MLEGEVSVGLDADAGVVVALLLDGVVGDVVDGKGESGGVGVHE